jgi:hypothetical protein
MELRMFCSVIENSMIWKMNSIAPGPYLTLSNMAMFGPQDDRLTASGLDTLMGACVAALLQPLAEAFKPT